MALVFLIPAVLVLGMAGAYVSPMMRLAAWILAGLPLCSALVLLWQVSALRHSQNRQSLHPEKHSRFKYSLRIANPVPLGILRVDIQLWLGIEGTDASLRELSISLKPWESRTLDFEISCPFRGIYQLGLTGIRIFDSLGIWSWSLTLQPQVFYVYPQLHPIQAPRGFDALGEWERSAQDQGLWEDSSRLQGVHPWREGDRSRNLLRRRFLETGQPWIRDHELNSPPGLVICLDLKRTAPLDVQVLDLEDQAFETAFSLIRAGLEQGIPIEFLAWRREWARIPLLGLEDFAALLDQSMQFVYRPENPGLEDSGLEEVLGRGQTVMIFSTRFHGFWLELLEQGGEQLVFQLWTDLMDPQVQGVLAQEAQSHNTTVVLHTRGAQP